MPTTLVGLLLFVVLLAPGLTYRAYRAANVPVQKLSALRELSGIALRSVVWDLVALAAFGIARMLLPGQTPDVGELVRNPHTYLDSHYLRTFWWGTAALAFACLSALAAASFASSKRGRELADRRPAKWFAPRGGVTADPAWWYLFNLWPDKQVYAGIVVDDGSYLGGYVLSFSPDSDETPDREISLSQPVHRPPGATGDATSLGVGAVAVSAAHIRYLTVSYIDPPAPTP